MEKPNGRWWRTPSFSVEDMIKIGFAVGPVIAGALFLWKAFGTVPADVATIKQTMATRTQVQSLVGQINDVNRIEAARLKKLEKIAKVLDVYADYRDIEVYHAPERREWDWQK